MAKFLFAFLFALLAMSSVSAYRVRRQDTPSVADDQGKTQELLKKAEQMGGQLRNKMKEYMDSGRSNLASAAEQAEKSLKEAAEKLKIASVDQFQTAKERAQSALESAKDSISKLSSNIGDKINGKSISDAFSTVSSSVSSAASSAASSVADAVKKD